jgi:glucose-6-phosphate isomerase
MSALTESAAWRALEQTADALRRQRISALFEQDADRAARYSCEGAGLLLDYSKQRVDATALQQLFALARQARLEDWIARMFGGEPINNTEQRAALHVALRSPTGAAICSGGRDVMPDVVAVRERMIRFSAAVRRSQRCGTRGQRFTDVVNIGIGGSDFGPRMVCRALAPLVDGPRPHFVANVDPAQLLDVLQGLDPATTLFIVTSKTFTTQETMANARAARSWLAAALGEPAVAAHFVAVSTNRQEVEKFGIAPESMFEFWDWVGGRYSLWSAVGLSALVALGADRFQALLAGAHAMDEHFRATPLERNMPVILGLLAAWNINFLGATSQVVIPYAQRLDRFVGWLQQLEMESNGKRIDRLGQPVDYATTPPLWGDVGTNAQHAFFQMLHQGSSVHPVDFILPLAGDAALPELQRMLIANCLAQSAALMAGKSTDTVTAELRATGRDDATVRALAPHRSFPGDRPSNTLLLPRLDPFHLGALLALYEHRTFVESVIWNINAFDQWGVELGKQIAGRVLGALDGGGAADLDASTQALLRRVSRPQAVPDPDRR